MQPFGVHIGVPHGARRHPTEHHPLGGDELHLTVHTRTGRRTLQPHLDLQISLLARSGAFG